jgi:hypothetical protein
MEIGISRKRSEEEMREEEKRSGRRSDKAKLSRT